MDKLKECPFCGGEAKLQQAHEDSYYVTCEKDSCYGYVQTDGEFGYVNVDFGTEAEAIKSWNTRHTPQRIVLPEKKDITPGALPPNYNIFNDEIARRGYNQAIEEIAKLNNL